jgi:hypothetical protein
VGPGGYGGGEGADMRKAWEAQLVFNKFLTDAFSKSAGTSFIF